MIKRIEDINSKIDQGEDFGKWTDPVSKFIYHDHFVGIFDKFDLQKYSKIEDLGGSNGLLSKFFVDKEFSTTDIDESKNPDFIGNIVYYNGIAEFRWRGMIFKQEYQSDLLIIRFVLHYMTDDEILTMFNNIKKNHKGDILVIQFSNEGNDMEIKRQNSINEVKIFRTPNELRQLFNDFEIKQVDTQIYQVTQEFYRNRLQNYEAKPHNETIHTYLLKI